MSFATPAALALGLLAIPIVLLHVLRPRRAPLPVSSTFLWRDAERAVSSATPWQRLRPSLLLLLQLLAVALLALVAAHPQRTSTLALSRHTVFVIDASGSMRATDVAPDRLGAARSEARRLRGELPDGGVASIVVASDEPRVVLSSSADDDAFDDALDGIEASSGRADFATAFSLAESLEREGSDVGFELISDGGLDADERALLPVGSHYTKVGRSPENRGFTQFTVDGGRNQSTVRATVHNSGRRVVTTPVRIDVDGVTAATRSVRVPPGASASIDVPVPTGVRYEGFLGTTDALDLDDRAVAVANKPRDLKVLLVGPASPFLDSLMAAIPGVVVERSEAVVNGSGFDVVVYNQVTPPPRPAAPFLAIAPPGGIEGVTPTGSVDTPAVSLIDAVDPLTRDLDLSDVAIATAQRLTAPGTTTLVGAEGAPLLVRGTVGSQRYLYLAFGLADSNLGLQVAFPLLGDRILSELGGGAADSPGAIVGRPLPIDTSAGGLSVTDPGGATTRVGAESAAPVAGRIGFWTVETSAAGAAGASSRQVAVNADPSESEIAPVGTLPTPEVTAAFGTKPVRGKVSIEQWFIAVLLVVLLLELLVARRAVGVPRRQWRWAMAARGAIAGLLVAAVLGPTIVRSSDDVATVFLIDGSSSVGSTGVDAQLSWVRQALSRQPSGALAAVSLFGGDAKLETTLRERLAVDELTTRIDPDATDLAGALRLAAAVLPTDAKRRVVLLSDGRATDGDTLAEARRLRAAGIRVDVHLQARRQGADVAVESIDVPAAARPGDRVTIHVSLTSDHATPVTLTLLRNGAPVSTTPATVEAGTTTVDLTDVAPSDALLRYEVKVTSAGDTVPDNDVGFGAVPVLGAARVLVIEGAPGEGGQVGAALTAGGTNVTTVAPTDLPDLDALSAFNAVLLVDVEASQLSAAQVEELRSAVSELGKGMVVVGGDHTYALGGYRRAPIEELLPVISDVTDPKRKLSVAQVLAFDTSGSMAACHCGANGNGLVGLGNGGMGQNTGGVTKVDIAKSAAERTIESLSADDEIGILTVNARKHWALDLGPGPGDEALDEALGEVEPKGGTALLGTLQEAATKLADSSKALKHIILFTDGFTSDSALTGLAEEAAAVYAEHGITVSVLATGEGAAPQLQAVAEAGHGRFYAGTDLSAVPQIMVQESIIASRNFVNEGEFFPEVTSAAAPVRGLTSSPALLGYVATTAKAEASTLLRIGPERDPLLTTWQLGLGRVTAWTSDAAAKWSQRWAAWDGYVDFWNGVVKDTYPAADSAVSVRGRIEGNSMKVTVEGSQALPDGANASATIAVPGGGTRSIEMERASGTTFTGSLPADEAGTYAIGTTISVDGKPVLTATGLASRSYPAEFRAGAEQPAVLAEIARVTRGRDDIRPGQAFDAAGLRPGRRSFDLAPWLVLAAALAWPAAVALGRLTRRRPVVAGPPAQPKAKVAARKVTAPTVSAPPPPPPAPPPGPPSATDGAPATVNALLEAKRRRRGGGD